MLRRGEPRLSRDEVAELAGIDAEDIPGAWRALGFPEPPLEAELWWPSDADLFASFALAAELFGPDRVRQFSRVMGRAAAQLAEAAVALFNSDVRVPLDEDARPPVDLARANVAGQMAADVIPRSFEAAFRHHVQAAVLRVDETTFTDDRRRPVLCVGFADLVGSTELAHRLDPAGTARLAADLEQVATDAVARASGRLVKTIGDGVLFTTPGPWAALAIADELVAWASADARLDGLRVGMASGPVVWQDGDVHGPVVNLAARLCDAATGGQVLVDAGFAAAHGAGATPTLVPAGERDLRGFAAPVPTFTPSAPPPSST
jgi:adenylate cyclase